MFNNIENTYQKIVESLFSCTQKLGNWLEVEYNYERRSEGVTKDSCKYLTINGDTRSISLFDEDFGLPKHFEALYQTMTADTDKHKWNRAKATLDNDGKLNIKFDWDQELADELEELSNEYDPRWDDTLTQEEKDKKYKEMVESGELPDLSSINISYEN